MQLTRRKLVSYGAVLGLTGPLWARAAERIRKTIPGTDERVPPVGIGTNRYLVGNAENNARLGETLKVFAQLGGSVIDTAPRYRTSESILGRLISELGIRDRLFLATKSNLDEDDGGVEQMEESRQKLQSNTIDLMQSHNLGGARSMLPVMREWQQEKLIRYIGVTTSRNNQFDDLIKLMENEPLDFVQVNYSLADREAAERILPIAQDKGIGIVINLPFGRGKLFSAVGDQPLPDWAAAFDCQSWAQFFLKYVISHPAVTCAIPGTTRPEHAVDNQGAAVGRLPDADERKRQESWFDAL